MVTAADWPPQPQDSDVGDQERQLRVTREDMLKWVKEVSTRSGRSRMQLINSRSITPRVDWNYQEITTTFSRLSFSKCKRAGGLKSPSVTYVALWFLWKAGNGRLTLCRDKLHVAEERAFEELEQLWKDEQTQPITYNHYYANNIQKARHSFEMDAIQKALHAAVHDDWNGKLHISNNSNDLARLMSALQTRVTVNMDDRACKEALEGMEAYYKVWQSRRCWLPTLTVLSGV